MPMNFFKNARETRAFEAGEVIFKEGDPGDVMYGVAEGRVELQRDGAVIEVLDEGVMFGELALVDKSPRGATAIAATDARLAAVDQRHFTFLAQEHPTFALEVMRH